MRRRVGLSALLVTALASVAAGGCSAPPIGPEICRRPETDTPQRYSGGAARDGMYLSAEEITVSAGSGELELRQWELLYFPGGAFYSLEHQLGETPQWWQFHLSFDRKLKLTTEIVDEASGATDLLLESGSLAPAAGNQVELKGLSDETITVVNASCVEYYLLVLAGSGEAP